MSNYRDMKQLAENPEAVRSLARFLLNLSSADWTDWEITFLDGMANRQTDEPISVRQREILVELRDNAKSYARVDGINVAWLIRRCHEARLDLDEPDGEFIAALQEKRATSLKRRPLLRLIRCARQLQLVDYVDIARAA